MPSLAKISILTLKPLHSFARSISRKTVNPIISKVDIKQTNLEYLLDLVDRNERQRCDQFFNKILYNGTTEQYLQYCPWKNTIDYYFRDYPSIMMNIENCSQFALRKMKKQKSRSSVEEIAIEEEKFIKKALIFMLWNKKRLAALVQNPKNAISQSSTMISAYITALGLYTLGEIKIGNQIILSILNDNKIDKIDGSMKLMPNIYGENNTLKQQIFFNMLIANMYQESINPSQNRVKTTPLQLFNRIKGGNILIESDFHLTDYESFLNLWFSYIENSAVQWSDLSSEKLMKHHKYLYLLAQNKTIDGDIWDAKNILKIFPKEYPPRVYLESIHLLQQKNEEGLKQKIKIYLTQTSSYFVNNPEFDMVIFNILNIPKRIAKSDEQSLEIDAQIQESRSQMCIQLDPSLPQSAVAPHYLTIPYGQFLVAEEFVEMFLKNRKMNEASD